MCGCISGAAPIDRIETWLAQAGFVEVRVTPRPESRELIKTWAPGRGIEDFVVSAAVEGRKPRLSGDTRGEAEGIFAPCIDQRFNRTRVTAMTSVSDARGRAAAPALGTFERYLTLWVALCILAGIVLGRLLPAPFHTLGRMTVAEVNIPVAVLIWLMIVPMLLKVDFGALHRVTEQWRGIAVTVGINWLVKPFSMALLGWLFIGWLFRPFLPAGQIDSYIAGLIILAAAPCTAMVFVWSNLTDGDANFTLSQVALNDTIMVFAFAPIVALLLGLSSITVPWTTLFLSVVLYIVVPVIAAQLWRRSLLAHGGDAALANTLEKLQPVSLLALLATLVLLFGFQGEQIVRQPLIIALLAVPIIIQVYLNAGIAYGLNRALGVPHNVACPSALIGASNFFELAVAAAIALFGFQSGAALATVVGVLVEVPVMLSVVRIVLRTPRLVRPRQDRLEQPNIDGRRGRFADACGNARRCGRDCGDLQ